MSTTEKPPGEQAEGLKNERRDGKLNGSHLSVVAGGDKVPTGDVDAAIDFLEYFTPGGPWVLSAIKPEQAGCVSETFASEARDSIKTWIRVRLMTSNLYYTVNPLLRPIRGNAKAAKADVRGMAWLHVDIDPRLGEPIDLERERALRLLREYNPAPTVIVDSGGGFQGFWRLDKEQPINGEIARAEELEAYNRKIALDLGADLSCCDCCRIMRLPGSINWPNEKKRRRGRVPASAWLVSNDN